MIIYAGNIRVHARKPGLLDILELRRAQEADEYVVEALISFLDAIIVTVDGVAWDAMNGLDRFDFLDLQDPAFLREIADQAILAVSLTYDEERAAIKAFAEIQAGACECLVCQKGIKATEENRQKYKCNAISSEPLEAITQYLTLDDVDLLDLPHRFYQLRQIQRASQYEKIERDKSRKNIMKKIESANRTRGI